MVRFLTSTCLVLAYLVLGGAVVGFLTGSSCYYSYCDDDDDHHHHHHDCDDDDDHHGSSSDPNDPAWRALAAADPEHFLIGDFTLLLDEEGDRWEVRALTEIRGVSLLAIAPLPTYSGQALRVFGDRILAVNESLIGLPPARFRRFVGVHSFGEGRAIDYRIDAEYPHTPSGTVRVLVDPIGRLVSIVKSNDDELQR